MCRLLWIPRQTPCNGSQTEHNHVNSTSQHIRVVETENASPLLILDTGLLKARRQCLRCFALTQGQALRMGCCQVGRRLS
jgi:hypothetical protein